MSFKGVLLFLGVFVMWFTLNRWVLPWFGIATCMSGRCNSNPCPTCGPPPLSSGEEAPGNQQRNQ
jgi:hypothetical protein